MEATEHRLNLKHFRANLFKVLAPIQSPNEDPVLDPVERFKAATREKLDGIHCLTHGRPPVVEFHGLGLRDIRISMRCCCRNLSAAANLAIAGRREESS